MTEYLPEAADGESLTSALRRCGALTDGRVSAVAVESTRATILSKIVRLRLTYDRPGACAPNTLIFKTGLPERLIGAWNGGRQEVAFYTEIASAMPAGLVPRCFEAEWDEDTKHWRLLLEDLTDSHQIATTWPLPPTREQCEKLIRTWARFHAQWWDDPRLGVSVGRWGDAAAVDGFLRGLAEKVAQFADRLGDRLPRERRNLYESLLDRAPRLLALTQSRRNSTIVHGDAHVWNCFLPRDGGADLRLFDWDSWRLGLATGDLAYMMAVHWYPDRRRLLERPLLDGYHAELVSHGVRGFDRRAFEDDYRLSALWQVATPVFQAAANIPTVIWWDNFERIFMAVDDLRCRELLG
jgi:Phosphotransferase enzyme family